MKYILTTLFITMHTWCSAQPIVFSETINDYHKQRIHKNRTGYRILGAWGLANVAVGGIGYFNAQQDEWKAFHAMNAGWGVLNTFVAATGLQRAHRERYGTYTERQKYNQFRADKRHFLLNACFDVVYIGVGVGLSSYSNHTTDNPELYRGFGKSVALQGVFLLVFDNVMYAAHVKSNGKWHRIMNELTVTGTGFNLNLDAVRKMPAHDEPLAPEQSYTLSR